MRLLDTTTLKFGTSLELETDRHARYAVLSHRWDKNPQSEVLFDDILSGKAHEKPCYQKVKRAAEIARLNGLAWIWIDTCCINKESSAELTESINSMYRWYSNAVSCYAYLQDIDEDAVQKPFHKSEWFDRGWTLQELLGPERVEFYDHQWRFLGIKSDLAAEISEATQIDSDALKKRNLAAYSAAEKLSWAARRKTTRPEDLAYCLLGIFDVNMVPIYGEGGPKAFIRLQEEIIKHDDDHSIFAWSMQSLDFELSGLLAPEPRCFQSCSATEIGYSRTGRNPFSVTNRGLLIDLDVTPWAVDTYLAFLECKERQRGEVLWDSPLRYGIFLRRLLDDDQYARVNFDGRGGLFVDESGVYDTCHDTYNPRPTKKLRIFVRHSVHMQQSDEASFRRENAFRIPGYWIDNIAPNCSDKILYEICFKEPLQLQIVDLPNCAGFKQIALGFDFDFNPICLLTDLTSQTLMKPPIIIEDNIVKGTEFLQVMDGSRVYSRQVQQAGNFRDAHDGIWRLKGHRLFGMNAVLIRSFNDSGPIIHLYRRVLDPLVWELEIDLADPVARSQVC